LKKVNYTVVLPLSLKSKIKQLKGFTLQNAIQTKIGQIFL